MTSTACNPVLRLTCRRCALSLGLSVFALPLAVHAAETSAETSADAGVTMQRLDDIEVTAQRYLPDYNVRRTRGATKTDTPLLDVPQAVTVVTDKLVADQAITSMAEAFRYMPGIGTAQGEGNRDTPVLRGNSSTADLFIDGIRDDVQYYRDFYNLDRVEALKGPNAMVFGRGGAGGVINRITRQADGEDHRAATLQIGSWQRRRGTVDYGTGFGKDMGVRLNAMLEDSGGFRDGYFLERYGFNPTLGFGLGGDTTVQLSWERFHDKRTSDRGVPSFQGRPLDVHPSTYFGDPAKSWNDATVDAFDAVVEHRFSEDLNLRNHLRWANYDKFYQNVFPGAVNAAGTQVSLAAYNADTSRRNLFNQTDLVWNTRTGSVEHTVLAGLELGWQDNDYLRENGVFAPGGNLVPIAAPTIDAPVEFVYQRSNDATTRVAATYVQDQIAFTPHWLAIVGVRNDRFRASLDDHDSNKTSRSRDDLWSPRAGLIWKPVDDVSVYASFSRTFLPRAGEQLTSLTDANAGLKPETFRNRELGAKWDIGRDLQASIAVYRLDRGNVAIADPDDPTEMLLVDGQRGKGVELGLAGRITESWQIMGGYAWQDGEISTTQSASIVAGNRLAQLPRNSASLWNRWDIRRDFGVGLGIVHRGAIYANVDNKVELPAFTRFDAAVYWTLNPSVQLQLNIENLADKRYFASAHSNNNLSPGAPRGAYLSANLSF